MVFYFTGTGNSLYVAKQLEKAPVSIPQVMRRAKDPQDARARPEFTAELAKTLCGECGIAVNYINMVLMVDNWLPSFDMNEQKALDKKVGEQLEAIQADLAARKNWIFPVTETDRAAHRQFLEGMSRMPEDAWQHLIQVKDGCVGCGICERVCPSGSIRVENGRAAHIPGNCQTCLACVHACPQKAIGLAVPEKNPDARYRNGQISLKEIMDANGEKENHEGGF